MENYTKCQLLELGEIVNKFNGKELEILPRDPYGWNPPAPPTDNHVFLRAKGASRHWFYRGSYVEVKNINYIIK